MTLDGAYLALVEEIRNRGKEKAAYARSLNDEVCLPHAGTALARVAALADAAVVWHVAAREKRGAVVLEWARCRGHGAKGGLRAFRRPPRF